MLVSDSAATLWPLLRTLYTEAQVVSGKAMALRALSLCAVLAPDPATTASARELVLGAWKAMDDSALRDELQFVLGIGSSDAITLVSNAVSEQITIIDNEWRLATERLGQRLLMCSDYAQYLAEGSISKMLKKGLAAQQLTVLTFWIDRAKELDSCFDASSRLDYGTECLTLASGPVTADCRDLLLRTFAERLTNISAGDQAGLLDRYFDLLKHQDASIRLAATQIVDLVRSATVASQDFKLGIAKVVTHLRYDVSPTQLLQYRPTLDALLGHSDLFEDYQWRDISHLARRSMSEQDSSLQSYGIEVVDRMKNIPLEDQADLVHLLIKLAKVPNTAGRAREVLEVLPERITQSDAAGELDNFLRPIEEQP